MRFLKILLILFSIIIIGAVIYVYWFEFSKTSETSVSIYLHAYLGFGFISSVINIIYHIISFRFYRREEKRNLDKKLSKILWIGTICFSAFLVYVGGTTLYSIMLFMGEFGYQVKDIFLALLFLVPGFFGLLEASLLKKRIKRLKTERDLTEEINDIGSSIT
ncbi:hypothetical protein IMCC3317_21200 [Kordia antarctica]|uniref:Uncharacterized protein n=1 Tax=Kordia antarctica TaxID=1218801 RepID=A0A7L4ZJN9_9FLAO|nr:hypothetical protein [Kordia antarctica]QHI36750.1 hypothetical protein IMCC3317_21200 [Kordia antarctica]